MPLPPADTEPYPEAVPPPGARGVGGLLVAALLAACALLTFNEGASTATLAATAALSLAGLALGYARPETGAAALIAATPVLPALPRLLSDPKGGPSLLAVALATLGAVAARRLAERSPSPLSSGARRWGGAFLAVALVSAVSSSLRGETLYLLARGGASPLFLNALYMTAADRTRDAGRAFLVFVLIALALDGFRRIAATPHGARRLLSALASGMLAAFVLTALEGRLPVKLTGEPWASIDRRAGTFTDPNALGLATALAIPLLAAALLDATRWSARRVTALLALLLSPVVLELAGSRSALVLLAVAGFLVAAGLWKRKELRGPILAAAVALVAIAVGGSFLLPRGGSASMGGLRKRLGAVFSSSSLEDASSHRPVFWQTAFETVEEEPLTGCGLAGFPYEFPARYARRHSVLGFTDNATNAILDTAAECGLPGLFLGLAAVVPFLVGAFDAAVGAAPGGGLDTPARAGGAALVGFAVACLTGSHFRFPDVALVAALAAAFVPRALDETPKTIAISGRIPLVVALSGILASLLVLGSTRRVDAAFRTGAWAGAWGPEVSKTRVQRWLGPRAFRRIGAGETGFEVVLRNLRPDRRAVLVSADVDGAARQTLTVPAGEMRTLHVSGIPPGAGALRLRFDPTFVPFRTTGARDFRELSLLLVVDSGEPPP